MTPPAVTPVYSVSKLALASEANGASSNAHVFVFVSVLILVADQDVVDPSIASAVATDDADVRERAATCVRFNPVPVCVGRDGVVCSRRDQASDDRRSKRR